MNNLIVFAHPNPNSFGKGILDEVVKASEESGAAVRIRDLYQLGFDPILKPADFETFQRGEVPQDIKDEQENIKWANMITFIYPVWWAGLPAMLKGYVDRVYSYGFAYEYVDGQPRGLLTGKKALIFCTTGTPSDVYGANGMHNSMKQTTDEGIFKFCGIEEVRHNFFGAVPHVSDEIRKDYLRAASEIVKDHISSSKSFA
ncbi:NAD(P)H dehydrogenase [Clostridium acetobutylicum]|nr:NAD(P)H dehydrogenase [Clostridium acetobutylicum]